MFQFSPKGAGKQQPLSKPNFFKGTRGNGRVGKIWSGRERVGTETGIPSVHFVPDHDFPTCSRPRSLLPPSTVPTYGVLFPSHRKIYSRLLSSHRPPNCSHPIPTFAHKSSHSATHSSGGCSCLIYHIPWVVYFSRHTSKYDYGCNWIIPIRIIQLCMQQLQLSSGKKYIIGHFFARFSLHTQAVGLCIR